MKVLSREIIRFTFGKDPLMCIEIMLTFTKIVSDLIGLRWSLRFPGNVHTVIPRPHGVARERMNWGGIWLR